LVTVWLEQYRLQRLAMEFAPAVLAPVLRRGLHLRGKETSDRQLGASLESFIPVRVGLPPEKVGWIQKGMIEKFDVTIFGMLLLDPRPILTDRKVCDAVFQLRKKRNFISHDLLCALKDRGFTEEAFREEWQALKDCLEVLAKYAGDDTLKRLEVEADQILQEAVDDDEARQKLEEVEEHVKQLKQEVEEVKRRGEGSEKKIVEAVLEGQKPYIVQRIHSAVRKAFAAGAHAGAAAPAAAGAPARDTEETEDAPSTPPPNRAPASSPSHASSADQGVRSGGTCDMCDEEGREPAGDLAEQRRSAGRVAVRAGCCAEHQNDALKHKARTQYCDDDDDVRRELRALKESKERQDEQVRALAAQNAELARELRMLSDKVALGPRSPPACTRDRKEGEHQQPVSAGGAGAPAPAAPATPQAAAAALRHQAAAHAPVSPPCIAPGQGAGGGSGGSSGSSDSSSSPVPESSSASAPTREGGEGKGRRAVAARRPARRAWGRVEFGNGKKIPLAARQGERPYLASIFRSIFVFFLSSWHAL